MSYYEKRMDYLKSKFGIGGSLQMEGEPDAKDETLKEAVRQRHVEEQKPYTVAIGSTTFRKAKLPIWLEVRL
jgi:hypothetical protein